ncbi:MAG: sulfotransferase domain-containing protein [Planctomycetota bacterium]
MRLRATWTVWVYPSARAPWVTVAVVGVQFLVVCVRCGLYTYTAWYGLTYQPYSKYIDGPDDKRKPTPWKNAIVGPLYMGHWEYEEIPKNGPGRAFFICRDPRDIVSSYYFSTRYAHRAHKRILPRRAELNGLEQQAGMLKCVEYLKQDRLFERIGSWFDAAESSDDVKVIRYESITGPEQFQVFRDLFDFCQIALPDDKLEEVLDKYSFKKMAKRKETEKTTNVKSHYRSGKSGDWQNHFDEEIRTAFVDATGDLLEKLGYETHANW